VRIFYGVSGQQRTPRSMPVGAVAACIALLIPTFALAAETVATLDIQAKLYRHKLGNFSSDVLAAGGPELGNVVAGDEASNATLVLVVVELAEKKAISSRSSVRLVARESQARGARVLLDRSQQLGTVDRGGRTHIAFWLPGTGCRPIALSATLTVNGEPAKISKNAELPFVCNE
jgi:hypothetical protein